MDDFVVSPFSPTDDFPVALPGQIIFEPRARHRNPAGIDSLLLLEFWYPYWLLQGLEPLRATLKGCRPASPLHRSVDQQQPIAQVRLIGLEAQTVSQPGYVQRIQSYGLRLCSYCEAAIFQFCHNKGHFSSDSKRAPLSACSRGRETPLSIGGEAADPDDLGRPRSPSQRLDDPDTRQDDQPPGLHSCRRGDPLRPEVDSRQSLASKSVASDNTSRPNRTIGLSRKEPHAAGQPLSSQIQQALPLRLCAPPRAPRTSALAPLERPLSAWPAGAAICSTALPSHSLHSKLLSEPLQASEVSPESKAALNVTCRPNAANLCDAYPTRSIPAAQPYPPRTPPTALSGNPKKPIQSSMLNETSGKIVTGTNGPQGNSRGKPLAPENKAGSSTPNKRKAAPNSKHGFVNDGSHEGNEEDEYERPEPNENVKPAKKHKGPKPEPFVCPKFRANPESCSDSRCDVWSSPDIASVTRHVKTDAKDDPEKLLEIDNLGRTKFTPLDRWNAYFDIFSKGVLKPGLRIPHKIKASRTDPKELMAQTIIENIPAIASDHRNRVFEEFDRLCSERATREQQAAEERQASISEIEKIFAEHQRNSDSLFVEGVAALLARRPGRLPDEALFAEDEAVPFDTAHETQEEALVPLGGSTSVPQYADEEYVPLGTDYPYLTGLPENTLQGISQHSFQQPLAHEPGLEVAQVVGQADNMFPQQPGTSESQQFQYNPEGQYLHTQQAAFLEPGYHPRVGQQTGFNNQPSNSSHGYYSQTSQSHVNPADLQNWDKYRHNC